MHWKFRWQSFKQFLSLGVGIKRWLFLIIVGAALFGIGLVYSLFALFRVGLLPGPVYDLLMLGFLPLTWRALIPLVSGLGIMIWAATRLARNLLEPFRQPGDSVVASLYQHSQRGKGNHIAAIGGGTGLPSLLRGLKETTRNITAIVTVADDGGSSGRLRDELGLLPPGDFRNNIAALARDEALMTQLLQYRFGGKTGTDGKGELQGHAFGNLLIAALTGVTGSFDGALMAAERVLALRGQVLPSTLEQVTLVAEIAVGEGPLNVTRVVGESRIPKSGGRVRRVGLEPETARAYPPAVQAILRADLVVIGPGSLYTSILPNLLVDGISEALCHSRGLCVYVCNIATQPGETDGYTVADHVDAIARHVRVDCLDYVIANDRLTPMANMGNTVFVSPEWPPETEVRARLVCTDLIDSDRPWRHDSTKLARTLLTLLGDQDSALR
jgi:uncharacterized cofD-like protein